MPALKFADVAAAMDEIEKASSRIQMTKLLVKLFSRCNADEIDKLVYLLQGQLVPPYKKMEIGLGEKFTLRAIANATGFSIEHVSKLFKEKGDLGLVAEYLCIQKRQLALFTQELTLKKVYSNFWKIASAQGKGSQDVKIKLLVELLNSAKPLEARYIVRFAVENLRLGIGDPTIMDAFAYLYLDEFKDMYPKLAASLCKQYPKDEDFTRHLRMELRSYIEARYNVYSDLGKLAAILKREGLKGLEGINIQPGIPIRPALAERLSSAEEIISKLGRCQVEAKYDGLRIQLHKDGERVWLFSRRQEDMTAMFPEIVRAALKQLDAKSVIVEGEALAYNKLSDEFYSFQVTIQRKRKYGVSEFAERYPLKLFLFDMLMYEGRSLLDQPFRKRRETLKRVLKKGEVLELAEAIVTDNAEKLEQYFQHCVARGLEGIVAKDLNAPYIAGARKFAWIKLKRSYKGELSDTLDLVIVGYFKGKGARTKFGLGALLAASYNKEHDVFESVAKIGSGFTEEQLKELERMLSKIALKSKHLRVVSELEPDVWVEPKYVIEVRADEITKSPVHVCGKRELKEGLALRFPRMIKLRSDKKPEQATTTEEIIKLFNQQKHTSLEREVV